jgi:UDP-3-O-[3-hydroxymyristoyl] glucosamine N-acyltransferase
MESFTVKQVAEAIGAEFDGDADCLVSGVAEPATAGPDALALAMEPKYEGDLKASKARAAVVWPGADWKALGLVAVIYAPRSRYVLSGVNEFFEKKPEIPPGVHPSAIIDPTAVIGPDAAIGPFVTIGARVVIGENARIASHCSIAEDARIGKNPLLYSGVRIGARVRIGDGFICQPNAVIGADGFSYVTPKPGAIEEAKSTGRISELGKTQGFVRINSLGSVVLGDRVEVGANCTIDRGTIADTEMGDGTKLDNQVQVGHNVKVGQNCLLCGQAGIAGSTVVGDRVVLGGQVGVADHLTIGSDVVVAGKSGISSNVPSGRVMMGNPAMRMDLNVEAYKALRRLPRLVAKVAELEKIVSKNDETR